MKEIWRDVPDYKGYYQVSNLGNVKSLDRYTNHSKGGLQLKKGKILKNNKDTYGYLQIGLHKENKIKVIRIHQLVAIVFLNHAPCGYKKVINHIDNNPINNHVNNLEIVDVIYNNRCHKNTSSRYPYVHWYKRRHKWTSRILHKGKRVGLGMFNTEEEAYKAYLDALYNINNGIKIKIKYVYNK